jgi:hypothetical protein
MVDFDAWSATKHLPEPLWTELGRTPEDNARYYVQLWKGIQLREKSAPITLTPEDHKWLNGTCRADAPPLRGKTEAQLTAAALKLFSWHILLCAADLGIREYTPNQRRDVWGWFEARCKKPAWELLLHSVTAPHIHAGRRDADWRKRHEAQLMGMPNA